MFNQTSRIYAVWTALAVALFAQVARANPDDLLEQAIEENRAVEIALPAESAPATDLLSRADQQLAQHNYAAAIALLEKAHAAAPRDQYIHLRLLRVKDAAGNLTVSEGEALLLLEEAWRAETASTLRQVRLNIIQAGQAITQGNLQLAEQAIVDAESLLDQLPSDVDASSHWKKLGGLRQSVAAHRSAASNTTTTMTDPQQLFNDLPLLTESGDESSTSGVARPSDTNDGTLINVNAALEPMEQRLQYEHDIYEATLAARSNTLLTASEAALPASADGNMTFPADWPERTARRARYRGGQIYRTPEFVGADGQSYYTAIYDLGDLVHPVPNFFADYPGTQRRTRIEDDDRFYLQTRSQIFNGFADDLAAGLPLMHFFGGIDNNAVTARTDPQQTERVLRIIDQFLHNAQPMQPN